MNGCLGRRRVAPLQRRGTQKRSKGRRGAFEWRQNHRAFPSSREDGDPQGSFDSRGAAGESRSLGESSLRWKASRVVNARVLHGARASSDLGFVDESTISSEPADFRRIDRGARGSASTSGARKTTPRSDGTLDSPSACRRVVKRMAAVIAHPTGQPFKVRGSREGPKPERERGATSSGNSRGTGARTRT